MFCLIIESERRMNNTTTNKTCGCGGHSLLVEEMTAIFSQFPSISNTPRERNPLNKELEDKKWLSGDVCTSNPLLVLTVVQLNFKYGEREI